MNSSDTVSVESVAVAARAPAITEPTRAVMPRITRLAGSVVILIHSLRTAAGTARRSWPGVRRAVLSVRSVVSIRSVGTEARAVRVRSMVVTVLVL